MIEWPRPRNPKALSGFLSLTGYYKRFIKNYGSIATGLTSLLRKNSINWKEKVGEASEKLKEALTQSLVLALSYFSKPFLIKYNACGKGIVAVLM